LTHSGVHTMYYRATYLGGFMRRSRLTILACILVFACVEAFAESALAQTVLPNPGIINTVAGNGTQGYSGDGGAATSAELNYPSRVAVDAAGNIYIADWHNYRVRKVTASTGDISTVAGNGTGGYSGDGGPATSAELYFPYGVAVDASGDIYIADLGNNRIRKVTVSTGDISTVAGNGTGGYSGDGGPATSSELNRPIGVAADDAGNLYIADEGNNRIRKVTASTGDISTVAGNGTQGYSGDGGAATSAEIYYPEGLAIDSAGNIYIVDDGNNRIRKVTASTGDISTVAGNGTHGYSGDGGAATAAELFYPADVAVDSVGNMYIADYDNSRIRKVTASTKIITTVSGNGTYGYSGDGGVATGAELNLPNGVALDQFGNIYVADTENNRIRVIGSLLITSASVATGAPPFGSFAGGPDIVNLANLNVHISVPVLSKTGRGTPFTYSLSYDSSVWIPDGAAGSQIWTQVPNWGWHVGTEPTTGYVSDNTSAATCGTGTLVTSTNFVFHDMYGVAHPFSGSTTQQTGACGSTGTNLTTTATDGSGYSINVTGNGPATITSRMGKVITPPLNGTIGAGTFTDANGNQISVNNSGVFTDTLGTTALTVAGTAPNPVTMTYTAPSGASAFYTMKYKSITVQTNFGCSGIAERSLLGVPLVSEIDLPDGTKYTFSYETTPGNSGAVTGRLASYTLPTGGTISYVYTGSNNGIECYDGSAPGMDRTTPDGAWTYARSSSGTAWTTTISDPTTPSPNQTLVEFQSIAASGTPTAFYETERQVYQGSTSGTLLKTTFTCYNGSTPNCNSTPVTLPITQRTYYRQWPGGLESETNTTYNSLGLVTEKDEYAYGSGAPGAITRKTLITYASLGNGIVGLPANVTIKDGSNNVKSQTGYTYDQGTVTATSGTPQHVAISGSRGNATAISYLVSGSTTLNKTFTYYDTGNVNAATDVNGAVTTYTYGSGTSCGNSFATSVSEPLSLSRSMVWNCTGGVQSSVTDENSQPTASTYSDPYFWRPNKVTDAASNVANFTYDAAVSVEGSVVFGSSTTDTLTTVDGLGRSHISQLKESPTSGTYDSVETDYDSLGRPGRTTVPYAAAASTTNSSAPGTNTTYDALSRKTLVADSGGGTRTVTYSYSQNDTYRTLGPAPGGEHTKRKQFEYDALGRMTSVCEVTSGTGSGACAQTSGATGYWTQYTYDVLNDLTGVTQNAQSSGSKQTRAYLYDDLGRLTSETNPEAAATTYIYDTDSTCGTSKGDLVKKVDAVGNTTCYVYDALHRVTSTSYSGPYSASTPSMYFVYDAATVNSVAMAYAKTRMAEAYTCVSPCSTKITDLGFSYTVLGQPTDVYESTPHSAGYYHVTGTYYANGALNQLTNLVGLPTITYGVDGEGRVYSASASSGQNPLTSTTYNTASLPTQVNLGSSDSDSFTFDPNSNRMTKYTFAVNAQSVVGSLTWNPIGTLETLGITDPFYGGGNQTCSYTHDDMSRIASANCGSPWAQTFTYDAFGNITKSGTISFQPTYSYLTNRMTQIGSSTPTYDADGNVLTDTAHTYAWDANGRPVTIDTVGLTYDALGRMVEQNKSGVYTEIAYGPTGSKLAVMSGQSLQKGFVPLAGGSVAVYNSSGLAYYRHSDWLGSSRFASTHSRALYYDRAYAPFGENYAQTGTTDLSFTGMNQDTVTNLFDFPAREYNGIHGRWPSPDPAGFASAYTNDPQTWNRYAYARNNPLSLTDPTGMYLPCKGEDCVSGADDGGFSSFGVTLTQLDPDTLFDVGPGLGQDQTPAEVCQSDPVGCTVGHPWDGTCQLDGTDATCSSSSIAGIIGGTDAKASASAAPCPYNDCSLLSQASLGGYLYSAPVLGSTPCPGGNGCPVGFFSSPGALPALPGSFITWPPLSGSPPKKPKPKSMSATDLSLFWSLQFGWGLSGL
jgi:RHS repeat-associated protein